MTPADIAAIEARVAAATPGPWRPQADTNRNGTPARSRWRGIYEPVPGQELGSRSCVMNASYKGMEPDDIWISCAAADMDLIAHAPTDLARLLADRRELEARATAAEAALADAVARERERCLAVMPNYESGDPWSGGWTAALKEWEAAIREPKP